MLEYFYQVVRYVERSTPLRANPRDACRVLALVQPPSRTDATMRRFRSFRRGRCRRRTGWRRAHSLQAAAELEAVRRCVNCGCPMRGDADWVSPAAKYLRIESTLRPRGRAEEKRRAGITNDMPILPTWREFGGWHIFTPLVTSPVRAGRGGVFGMPSCQEEGWPAREVAGRRWSVVRGQWSGGHWSAVSVAGRARTRWSTGVQSAKFWPGGG